MDRFDLHQNSPSCHHDSLNLAGSLGNILAYLLQVLKDDSMRNDSKRIDLSKMRPPYCDSSFEQLTFVPARLQTIAPSSETRLCYWE